MRSALNPTSSTLHSSSSSAFIQVRNIAPVIKMKARYFAFTCYLCAVAICSASMPQPAATVETLCKTWLGLHGRMTMLLKLEPGGKGALVTESGRGGPALYRIAHWSLSGRNLVIRLEGDSSNAVKLSVHGDATMFVIHLTASGEFYREPVVFRLEDKVAVESSWRLAERLFAEQVKKAETTDR